MTLILLSASCFKQTSKLKTSSSGKEELPESNYRTYYHNSIKLDHCDPNQIYFWYLLLKEQSFSVMTAPSNAVYVSPGTGRKH